MHRDVYQGLSGLMPYETFDQNAKAVVNLAHLSRLERGKEEGDLAVTLLQSQTRIRFAEARVVDGRAHFEEFGEPAIVGQLTEQFKMIAREKEGSAARKSVRALHGLIEDVLISIKSIEELWIAVIPELFPTGFAGLVADGVDASAWEAASAQLSATELAFKAALSNLRSGIEGYF
ncbi:hypothetical protein RQP46_004161 [Phenoliferia psychrophenolica]